MNMATSSFSIVTKLPPFSKTTSTPNNLFKFNNYFYISSPNSNNHNTIIIKSEFSSSSSSKDEISDPKKIGHSKKLGIGSPIVVIEAPKTVKTAASVPCLRINHGLINPGDVGRIVSRKPKDVWAIRLSIGTYLIDGKYFKPLELDE